MAKKTLKQQHLEFLKAHGWTEDSKAKSTKYLTLTKPGVAHRYFLGNAGAVRRGKNVSSSVSVKLKLGSKPSPLKIDDKSGADVQRDLHAIRDCEDTPAKAAPKPLDDPKLGERFLLMEGDDVIGTFDSVAAAKAELQGSWGDGQPQTWTRNDSSSLRKLTCEQFSIVAKSALERSTSKVKPRPVSKNRATIYDFDAWLRDVTYWLNRAGQSIDQNQDPVLQELHAKGVSAKAAAERLTAVDPRLHMTDSEFLADAHKRQAEEQEMRKEWYCETCGKTKPFCICGKEDEQGSDPTSSRSATAQPAVVLATSETSRPKSAPAATSPGTSFLSATSAQMTTKLNGPTKSSATVNSAQKTETPLSAVLKKALEATVSDKAPHIIGMARAGTGKTTTGEEGLKKVRGLPTRIEPSPQQAAIWEAMEESKGAGSIGFTAFGKDIADEVEDRLKRSGLDKMGCEGLTTHRMGFRAVRDAFKIRPGKDGVNSYVVQDYLASILGKDCKQLKKDKPVLVNAVEELVGLCKQTLSETSHEALGKLAHHYDVETNGCRNEVFDLVPQVLNRCLNPEERGQIDFNDMIWLAVAHKLPGKQYDFLIVDEAQDLNRARQEIVKMYGRRLMLVGDDRQAIFGFAGADAEAMKRMETELQVCITGSINSIAGQCGNRGVVKLPLTVTRRCGKAIVEEARQYVPDFEAHPSNPEGKITQAKYPTRKNTTTGKTETLPEAETYLPLVQDGDRVLCRCNAPLVSNYFKLIKMGRDATILGREIGAGLLKLVEKLGADSVPQFVAKVAQWQELETSKELAQKNPSESRINLIGDKACCLLDFAEGAQTIYDIKGKMEQAFADKRCPRCKKGFFKEAQQCWACKVPLIVPKGVQLSSIHKAKGLEAKRVFWLRPPGVGPREDKMKGWELTQEENLKYVAITRAIEELVYVS